MAEYDVIVAGGGLAGTIVAQSVLHHNQNLKVLVVDRSPVNMPGQKSVHGWVCGDAVSKEAVDYMTDRIKIEWTKPEIEHYVKGVMAFSPNRETSIPFDGEGYMLNRQVLPQMQNERAIKRGAEIIHGVNLTGLLYDNNQIVGVKGLKNKEPYKKTAKVVVDTTGMTSMLRNGIENTRKIEKKINRQDVESTGRHIMYFEPKDKDLTYFDPDYCIIHLDQDIAPGGYGWVFPKSENKVNIGLGVEKTLLEERNKRLGKKDNVSTLIEEYVSRNTSITNPKLSQDPEDSNNATGNFQVSVRRQNDCMVANGFILVGDSAWMPKPLDAGGIGPAIVAGTIAGKCVVEAIESNDVTEVGLWNYNKKFIDEYGYKTAGLEIFRRLIQKLTNKEIDYGMKHFLNDLDVEAISKGEHPNFSGIGKIQALMHGLLSKTLADGLRFTTKQNKKLTTHYYNYPESPDGFEMWNIELHKILDESNERLGKFRN